MFLPLLVAGLGLVLVGHAPAQTFTTLYSFSAVVGTVGMNNDGAQPWRGVILSGNTFYGTCEYGGSSGDGTVFAVNTDGTGFATLYSFTGGSDGGDPYSGLILSSNTLEGISNKDDFNATDQLPLFS